MVNDSSTGFRPHLVPGVWVQTAIMRDPDLMPGSKLCYSVLQHLTGTGVSSILITHLEGCMGVPDDEGEGSVLDFLKELAEKGLIQFHISPTDTCDFLLSAPEVRE